jgi:hypothetical protein
MHVAADFILQGNRLSKLKAHKLGALFTHVGAYTLFFIAISPLLLGLTFMQGVAYSLINGGAHLLIDFFTSKLKNVYWNDSESRYMAVISADHVLHILILIATYIYLYPEAYASV